MELIKKIPDKSVDLIVMDPPYEKVGNGYYAGGGMFGTTNRTYHIELDSNNLLDGINTKLLDELIRVMKKCNIYIWCNKQQLRMYIDYFDDKGYNLDLITWHKTNPIPTCNNKYLSDTEYVLFFRENGVKVYGSYDTKHKYYVTATNKDDKNLYNHPTIKPLNIIKNFIINSSLEGEVVMDPFMGSGTTGVACTQLNRNFIGFEINDTYFNTAKNRINKENSSQPLYINKQDVKIKHKLTCEKLF